MFEANRKSTFTDHLSHEIDVNENGIYAIGHTSEKEREKTRKLFQENKENNERYNYDLW